MNESINNTEQNTSTVSNESKKKKKKHRFLKFLLFLLILFLGIRGIFFIKDSIKNYKYKQLVLNNTHVLPTEKVELSKEELALDSNNDNLTNQEKMDLGLSLSSADTDGDGLTDYDEINVYHSDPKKFSTSGDLLSDYYKVQNQLNINQKYDTVPSVPIDKDNMKFIPKKAEDVKAYYKDYNGMIPSGYVLGMKPLRVYSFTGDVSINIENPEYYDVYYYNTSTHEVKKAKSKVVDNSLTFSIKDESPILIAYKKKIIDKLNQNANTNYYPVIDNPIDNEYIIIATPFFNVFFNVPVLIFQINDSNHYLEQKYNTPESKIVVAVRYIGTQEAKVLDTFFAGFRNKIKEETGVDDDSLIDYVFYYAHIKGSNRLDDFLLFSDFNSEEEEEIPEEEPVVLENPYDAKYLNDSCEYCANSGFSVGQNAFRFSNPSTTVSQGGICLGIAHITTNAFNKSSLPRVKDNKYDLSSIDYETIWNGSLYQYVPSQELGTYADNIRGNEVLLDSNKMTYPDNQLIKALDYYWDKINSDVRWNKFSWAWNNSFAEKVTPIDSGAIDEMIEQFRNNKIVSVLFLGEGQHAVNAYRIVQDQYDEDILYLKAYDNNFPNDMFWNKAGTQEKYDITITLYRKYETTLFGNVKTYYLFNYSPLNSSSYYWRNDNGELMTFLIINENGEVLG